MLTVPRYALSFQTQTDDSVTLPAVLDRCITQGQSVLIITVQGDLLLWTFLRGVAQIETSTMPQNHEAYCGPSKSRMIPSPPLTRQQVRQSTFMFHPQDTQVFFMTTFGETDPGWILVSEFRDRLCSRVFTYSFTSPMEMITRKSSTWDKLKDYDGILEPSRNPDLMAKKADAHGTYMLLKFRGRIDGTYRLIYVMFNTLTTSFSGRNFEPPLGYDHRSGEPALVWNGQLCLHASRHRPSHPEASYPSPLLVLQSLKTGTSPKEERPGTQWEKDQPEKVTHREDKQDELELRGIQEETLTSTMMQQSETYRTPAVPKKDIVRYQDIARAYPLATDFHSKSGLLYMCSFYGGECSSDGPHVTDCTRCPPVPPSGETVAPRIQLARFPINYFSQGGGEAWQYVQPEAIFGDDDFLIVVTAGDLYTVFAVDPDRKMAKALSSDDSRDIMDIRA